MANTKKAPVEVERPSPREVPAGPFSEWLHETHRARKLGGLSMSVPCGDCNACCRASHFVHVHPNETSTIARIPRRLLLRAPGLPTGHVLLGYDEKGRCPMLSGDTCSIYDDRPQTCRDFDCRVFAAAGIEPDGQGPQAAIAERVREWKFEYPAEVDSIEHDAVRVAGRFLCENSDSLREFDIQVSPLQLALLAVRFFKLFLNGATATENASASPAETIKRLVAELERNVPRSNTAKRNSNGQSRRLYND